MGWFSGQLKDKDITWGVGASIGIGFAAYLVPQLIVGVGLAIWAGIQGKDFDEIFADDNIVFSFFLTLAITTLGVGVVMLYVKRKDFMRKIGFRKVPWEDLGLALPAYIVYFFLAAVVSVSLAAAFPEIADQEQETGFTSAAGPELILAFITLVVLAPFYEELLFRGFIFRGIAKATSFWPAAISVSALFGLAHGQINVALDTLIIGVVASWLVWHTKSIWPAILLHVIKNAVAYIFIFVLEVQV